MGKGRDGGGMGGGGGGWLRMAQVTTINLLIIAHHANLLDYQDWQPVSSEK